jgi:hypothetical protein
LDEDHRAEQMASLEAQRLQTEKEREQGLKRAGLSAAQEARKRKLDERRLLVDAKRVKLLGGEEEVRRLQREYKAAEAEDLLQQLELDIQAKVEGK